MKLLQAFVASVLLISGSVFPSYFSIFYLFSGLMLTLGLILTSCELHPLTRISIMLSFVSVSVKAIFLFILYTPELFKLDLTSDSFVFKGLFLDENEWEMFLLKNFGVDALSMVAFCVLYVKSKAEYQSKFNFLGIPVLFVGAVTYISYTNLAYSIILLVLCFNLRYKSTKTTKICYKIISVLSLSQIVAYYMLNIADIPTNQLWVYGVISKDSSNVANFILVYFLHLIFTILGYNPKKENNKILDILVSLIDKAKGLIDKHHEGDNFVHQYEDESFLDNQKPKSFEISGFIEDFLHVLSRILLISCIIYFNNIFAIVLMILFFWALLSMQNERVLCIYRYFIIPVIIITYLYAYSLHLIDVGFSIIKLAEVSFLLLTAISFLIIVRRPFKIQTKTIVMTNLKFLLDNSHYLILFGIMACGLHKINLTNGVLLGFYFMFVIYPNLIPKYWIYLLIWSMIISLVVKIFNVHPDLASLILSIKYAPLSIDPGFDSKAINVNELILWTLVVLCLIQY